MPNRWAAPHHCSCLFNYRRLSVLSLLPLDLLHCSAVDILELCNLTNSSINLVFRSISHPKGGHPCISFSTKLAERLKAHSNNAVSNCNSVLPNAIMFLMPF